MFILENNPTYFDIMSILNNTRSSYPAEPDDLAYDKYNFNL